jgi:hypothetical protein
LTTYNDRSYIFCVDVIPKIELSDEKEEITEGHQEQDEPEKPSFIAEDSIEIQYEPSEFVEEEEEPVNHSEHDFETELSELFAKYAEQYPELSSTLKQLEASIIRIYRSKNKC